MTARERLDAARERLAALFDDPFGGLVLRDLVPRGRVITVALDSEPCLTAVKRAIADSGGYPAFLAVDEPGREALTILTIERDEDGRVSIARPGDWATPLRSSIDPGETLGEVIAMLRASNEGSG